MVKTYRNQDAVEESINTGTQSSHFLDMNTELNQRVEDEWPDIHQDKGDHYHQEGD